MSPSCARSLLRSSLRLHGVSHDTASPMPMHGVSGVSGVSGASGASGVSGVLGVSGVSGVSGVLGVLKKLAWWKSGAWLGLF